MADFRPTFHWLKLEGVRVADKGCAPAVIAPLIEAVARSADLTPVITSIITSLGFDTFMYGLSTAYRPGQDSMIYTFTTVPREWGIRFDQAAYIEVDPRIQFGFDNTLPFFWDQLSERGKSERLDHFLDEAYSYGLCSGLSCVLPDRDHAS